MVWTLLLTACSGAEQALPPLPAADHQDLQPAVQERLYAAYTTVINNPPDASANGDLALLLHTHGRIAAAEAFMYERVRSSRIRSGEPEAAIVILEQLIARHGSAGPAHFALSQAYRLHADPASAEHRQCLFERFRDTHIPVDDRILSNALTDRAGRQP